MKPVNKV